MTKTEIANEAIRRFGGQRISDIAGSTPEAVLLRDLWAPAVREIGRGTSWACLRSKAVLARTTTPLFNWAYAYTLPGDCLRIVQFNDIYPEYNRDDFEVVGTTIETDAEEGNLVYVKAPGEDETGRFDQSFISCLVLLLAARASLSYRQGPDLTQPLMAEYREKLSEAQRINAQQQRPTREVHARNSRWVRGRRWGTVGGGD